jgi:hypothetical protein
MCDLLNFLNLMFSDLSATAVGFYEILSDNFYPVFGQRSKSFIKVSNRRLWHVRGIKVSGLIVLIDLRGVKLIGFAVRAWVTGLGILQVGCTSIWLPGLLERGFVDDSRLGEWVGFRWRTWDIPDVFKALLHEKILKFIIYFKYLILFYYWNTIYQTY